MSNLVLLLGILLSTTVATAQIPDCIPYAGLPAPLASCSLDLGATITTAAARGPDHLVVHRANQLEIYDVGSASAPQLVGLLTGLPFRFNGSFAIIGQVAYLPTSPAQIVDLGDPAQPMAVADLGEAFVSFAGDGVLLAGVTLNETLLFDCSDPVTPVLVGTIADRGAATFLGGSLGLLSSGFRIYDVSDPAAASLVSSLEYPVYMDIMVGDAELVGDQLILVTDSNGSLARRRIDLSDPGVPAETAYLATRTADSDSWSLDYNLYRRGSFLIDGRQVFDPLSADLATVAELPVLQPILGGVMDLGADRVAVCDGDNLTVVSLADPPVSNLADPLVHGTAVYGTFVGAEIGDGFLAHVGKDTDPDNGYTESYVALFAQPGQADANHVVFGDLNPACVAGAGRNLVLGNLLLRVAEDFSLTSSYPGIASGVRALAFRADHELAAVSLGGGLQLLDVADPAEPVLLGQTPLPAGSGSPRDVVWQGDLALVAAAGGLAVIRADGANPPQPAALLAFGGGATWVASISADQALVQAGDQLVRVDVSDPDSPVAVASRHAGVLASRPLVQGGLAYATLDGLVTLYDLATLAPVGTLVVDETLAELGLWDGHLVGAGRSFAGCAYLPPACEIDLVAVDDTPAAATFLLGASPNPFNPQTIVRFRLDVEQPIRLAVFDPRGRLVRELARGGWAAGEHQVRWDGRDAAGQPASAGIYVLRLEMGAGVQTAKAALVK